MPRRSKLKEFTFYPYSTIGGPLLNPYRPVGSSGIGYLITVPFTVCRVEMVMMVGRVGECLPKFGLHLVTY